MNKIENIKSMRRVRSFSRYNINTTNGRLHTREVKTGINAKPRAKQTLFDFCWVCLKSIIQSIYSRIMSVCAQVSKADQKQPLPVIPEKTLDRNLNLSLPNVKELNKVTKQGHELTVNITTLNRTSAPSLKAHDYEKISNDILNAAVKKELRLEDALKIKKYRSKAIKLKLKDIFTENVVKDSIKNLKAWGLRTSSKQFDGESFLKNLYELNRVYKTKKLTHSLILQTIINEKDLKYVHRIYGKLCSNDAVEVVNTLKILSHGEGVAVKMWKTMYEFAVAYKEICEEVLARYNPSFKPHEIKQTTALIQGNMLVQTKDAFRKMWVWGKEYDKAFGKLLHEIESNRVQSHYHH